MNKNIESLYILMKKYNGRCVSNLYKQHWMDTITAKTLHIQIESDYYDGGHSYFYLNGFKDG